MKRSLVEEVRQAFIDRLARRHADQSFRATIAVQQSTLRREYHHRRRILREEFLIVVPESIELRLPFPFRIDL